MKDAQKFSFEPIGVFHCGEKYRYDAPRQGVFANGNIGVIELDKGKNYEQALSDLDGVERLWVVFVFHNNSGWKAKTSPPVAPARKIGVFATRSPYRPNPIGLSCVELVKVEGLRIFVRNFDLLDGSPILDIKPYISLADSFPESRVAWLEEAEKKEFSLEYSPEFIEKNEFIKNNSQLDPMRFCEVQLSINPLDNKRKRLTHCGENRYIIAFRTWKIEFCIDEENFAVKIKNIRSSYMQAELLDLNCDKYNDKQLHRDFIAKFP